MKPETPNRLWDRGVEVSERSAVEVVTTDIGKTYTIEVRSLLDGKTRNLLSPNGGGHWAAVKKAHDAVFDEAYQHTRLAKGWWLPTKPLAKVIISVDAAFWGAGLMDKHDNFPAMIKPLVDGVMACLNPTASAARRDANVELGTLTLVSRRRECFFNLKIEVLE